MRWAIVDQSELTNKVRGGQKERLLPNGQALIRVNEKNEDILREYIKLDADSVRSLDLKQSEKFKRKLTDSVSVDELKKVNQDQNGNPKYAIVKPAGDYNTRVSHNFATDGSSYELAPSAGEKMIIGRSELQFEHDLDLAGNSVSLNYYVWHPSFDDPIIGQTITFDSIHSLFEIGNSHFTAPPIGSMTNSLTTLQFEQDTELVFYGTRQNLALAKLSITTSTGSALTGSYVTVSFITRTESI